MFPCMRLVICSCHEMLSLGISFTMFQYARSVSMPICIKSMHAFIGV